MTHLPLIGLTGQKGVGKDTVADYITARYGYKKMALADPLKQACEAIFGLSKDQLNNPELKEQPDYFWGKSPRHLMQFLGTDLMRCQFDTDIWTKLIEKRSNGDLAGCVISDIRFPNEREFVKRNGGMIIKIIRPNLQNDDMHESEQGDISADHVISNCDSINELYKQIDSISFNIAM